MMDRKAVAWMILLAAPAFASKWQADEAIQKGKDAVRNPLARNPAAIQAGQQSFMARCAFCHGTDGKGTGRGSNLTRGTWAHGGRDSELFNTIKKGVPGTE